MIEFVYSSYKLLFSHSNLPVDKEKFVFLVPSDFGLKPSKHQNDSMHIGVLAASTHATTNRNSFTIFYNLKFYLTFKWFKFKISNFFL